MATKRVSVRTRSSKRTPAKPSSELADSAVLVVLESAGTTSTVSAPIDAEVRRRLIATAAYFSAERRGFEAGHELEDWVAAEVEVDALLRHTQAA